MIPFPTLESRILLAPLAGVNDPAFRLLCRQHGAAMVWSEMISAEALCNNSPTTQFLLEHSQEEHPIAFQLFGENPASFVKAAKIVEPFADVIDINMGCPVDKVTRIGACVALMSNLERAEEIIRAVVNAVNKPVTVKMRLGFTKKTITCVKLARIAEDSGAAAITLHPRTGEQGYSGKIAIDFIRQIKQAVKIPVIGNGNVIDGASADRMFKKTGCDYIMIGRAAMGNPAVFREINSFISGNPVIISASERLENFFRYVELAKRFEHIHFQYIKQHAVYFTKGLKSAKQVRSSIMKAGNLGEVLAIMNSIAVV